MMRRSLSIQKDTVTGRIVNSGDTPVKHVKLVAVAHDENHAPLDVVQMRFQ